MLYRLGELEEVDEYIGVMGVTMPSSKEFAVENWRGSPEQKDRKSEVLAYLRKVRLLDPLVGCGWHYSKPVDYLGIALVECCKTFEEVKAKVSLALEGT